MLLAGLAGLYGLTQSSAFDVRRTQVTGATWTSEEAILTALAVPSGQNVFTVSSADLAGRLAAIPAIRSSSVTVTLPDQIRVAVTEREALVVWRAGGQAYLVDTTGLLFAALGPDAPAEAERLPVVVDARAASASLAVGATLDPVTLDAALRLGSLAPADLESSATDFAIRVDDTDGFVLTAEPGGWTAVFGFYTPTLRTTDLIPGQVRLLRSLIHGREAKVGRVILADDRGGTYLPRGSAAPTASPKATPKPTPKPTAKPKATPKPTARPKPTPRPTPSP